MHQKIPEPAKQIENSSKPLKQSLQDLLRHHLEDQKNRASQ